MAQGTTVIPIDHHSASHEIDTEAPEGIRPLTLMELVEAVGEVSDTEQEILATVTYMLRSGRIRIATTDDPSALVG